MHELAITCNVVAIVEKAAQGRRVSAVTLEIGQLAGVLPDAVAFCFDGVTQGTLLEGAALTIRQIEGRGRCRACGAEFSTTTIYQICACGSADIDRISGEELNVREIVIEEND